MKTQRKCEALLRFAFINALVIVLANRVFAINYYVDTTVNPSGNGTSLATAFKTIQEAATVAAAGDTVFIRAGTYRETVTPANSGSSGSLITFKPYNNEAVTISGADVVSGWTLHTGSIYKTTLGYTTKDVFVSGGPTWRARWPNAASTDPLSPTFALADSGTTATPNSFTQTIVDTGLTLTNTLNGARVWFLAPYRWYARTASVTSHISGSNTFGITITAPSYGNDLWDGVLPGVNGPFFLYNHLDLLDNANEWFQDNSNVLYLQVTGGGSPTGVEARRRETAFNLSNRNYITIEGLKIFSARLLLDGSQNCLLENLTIERVCPFVDIIQVREREKAAFILSTSTEGIGVYVTGSNNTLSNCIIRYSWGDGVTLGGTGNKVINCTISDVAAAGGMYSAISPCAGSGHMILYNTISKTGVAGMRIRALDLDIYHNAFSDIARINWDTGGIYSNDENGNWSTGTIIAYNDFSQILTNRSTGAGSYYGGTGVFLDNNTSGVLVHHNVVRNSDSAVAGVKLNWGNQNNEIYNNTFDVSKGMDRHANGYTMTNVKVYNNLSVGTGNWQGTDLQNNLVMATGYVDKTNGDYQLSSGATAINYGVNITGITDGYYGSAPDAGAFERSGVTLTTQSLPSATVGASYSANLTASGGTTPYTWSLINSSYLPAGLSLSSGGVISGTPTAAGTGRFSMQVADAAGTPLKAIKDLSIVVNAVTTAPSAATTPSPSTGSTNQSTTATLSWANGGGATSYDVYFGTDSTPDSTELIGNQAATTYNPGTLTANTTYYWRIDAKNANGTTTGDVWSFTTAPTGSAPSKATTPSPANNATAQLLTGTLSWANGGGATSYDVYFGTDSTPDSTELIGNQAGTAYNPGTLTANTTYYWRIDAKNANGTTTGDVWSFTTLPTPNYYWKFDNSVTATNGGINGTLQNGATYTASGKINQSLDLDGVNDYVSTANIINPSSGNFTVTAWVWLDAETAGATTQIILQQEGTTGRSWLYRDLATDKLATFLGASELLSTATLATGQWHFVGVTKSGTTVTLYVNGSASGSATRTVESSTGAMRIGAHKNPSAASQYWDGRVDDLRVYTVALTATQISALYNNPGQ